MLRRWTPEAASLVGALALAACPSRAAPSLAPVAPSAATSAGGAATPAVRSPAGEPTGALRARVEAVAEAFRARDAHPLVERWVAFLPPSGAQTMRVRVARDICLGFVAVGRESLTDIDLYVHNGAGVRIAQDVRADAHPYARVCVRGSENLHVVARANGGAGEVAVLTLADPPLVPPDLDAVLGVRASGAFTGPRTPRLAIGPDPAAPDAPHALELLTQRLVPLGYRRVGAPITGVLPMRRQEQRRARLEAGTCYAIVATGGRGVEDLDLQVNAPDGRPIARDTGTDNHPMVRVCPAQSGEHAIDVGMYSGAGSWALAVMAMDPAIELPADVVGIERANALDLAAEARRRGMGMVAGPVRMAVVAGASAAFPLAMRAGRCYLLGAASGEGVVALDVSLIDDHGAVLAADSGDRGTTRVYHCARRALRARVEVRGVGGRGEFAFLGFESVGGSG